jgi:predicted kinase
MKPSVYIFRGAPASGKGTLLPKFCELLPQPVVLIEQDKLRWGFHLINRKVADVSDEEHKLAYDNTCLLYEQYLKSGRYTIVIEGLFTWDNQESSQGSANHLIQLAKKRHSQSRSIVLKADKKELLKRNANRSYSVPLDEFEMLYKNIYQVIDPSEIILDSTNKDTSDTLKDLKQLVLQSRNDTLS